MLSYVVFFFFKQKTAYEMRISDWSSDVCSSDLLQCMQQPGVTLTSTPRNSNTGSNVGTVPRRCFRSFFRRLRSQVLKDQFGDVRRERSAGAGRMRAVRRTTGRSEEHTSELQSLMRISYAVFCLKQQTN